MSRYRNIHCLIWNDDKFPFASDECQLVFFHLITTPFSSPFGLYKASLEALAAEKRWSVKAYREAFQEAFEKGFVKYDERTQVILLPHFLKYNPPGNPNVLKGWGKQFQEIPSSPLKVQFYEELKAFAKGLGKAFAKAFEEGFKKPLAIQEQEQITGTDPKCGWQFSHPPHAQDLEDLEQEQEQELGRGRRARAHTQDDYDMEGQDAVIGYTFPAAATVPPGAAGCKPPEDFVPTPAFMALARRDAPHVDLDNATKRFMTIAFRKVLDWGERWYRFMLEEESKASSHNGSRPSVTPSFTEQRQQREAAAIHHFREHMHGTPARHRRLHDRDEDVIDGLEYRVDD